MTDIEAPIQEVTVYADRALITRRGTITLEAGNHDLRINDLPFFIQESLRATGNGPEGTRILNVDVTTAFHSRTPDSVLLLLMDEVEQLYQRRNILEVRQRALKDRGKWLSALGEQSRDFARGLARGQMTAQDCAEFFRFMAGQAQDDAEAAQQLENERKALQKEIDAKERELEHKRGYDFPDRLAAVVSLELPTAGDFTLELSYIVEGASWHPQYDVRVKIDESGSKGEVELTYLGMVQQSTSERWENVHLSLSTARPSLSAVLPELDPWYLNTYTPPPPPRPMHYAAPMMASVAQQPSPGAVAGFANEQSAAMDAPVDMLEYDGASLSGFSGRSKAQAAIATATVEHTGTALVFHVGRSVDIPSDNSPHKTTIAIDMLPCDLDYVTAPILEENAHLRAAVTNTTEQVLLKGHASIFLNNEYVGTTEVKTTAPTEKFKIFLGIDDTIKVERKLIERAVDKGNLLQTDIRRITYAYRITVHNYAQAPRTIEVRDHLPVSQHERIKIKGQQISPQPAERSKLELLEWRFVLPADSERIIEHRFVVEHPQGIKVIGLPD